jgi:endonuclease/exonuclease/phosphatase family metal-dependent hydrolase
MRFFIAILLVFGTFEIATAQDTLRIMTHNLLGYPSASDAATKNSYMSQIVSYIQPDILAVQEMETDVPSNPTTLLNGALNVNGASSYSASNFAFTAGSNIGNMLYYNNTKLALKAQYSIPYPSLREMNHYRLYYLSPDLPLTHDTIFINVIVMHLKASSTAADEAMRQSMATALMSYLNSTPIAQVNTVVLGDSNIYNPSEPAFQTFTNYTANPAINFVDPLDSLSLATWHDNAALASQYTQSTRNSSLPDGGATGGMDDRFDILLTDAELSNGTANAHLLTETYKAVGQDGLRHNQNLISPTNNSAPSNVISALYNMSDHLPVIADIKIPTCTPPQPVVLGENIACLQTPYTYSVAPTAGHEYQWSISNNGSIVSGQNTSSVTVIWNDGMQGTVTLQEW